MSEIKDLNKEASQESRFALDSHELKRSSTTGSAQSEESGVEQKSFGLRRSELIMAELSSWWLKGGFFFTIFICMYIALMESSALRVFTSYATDSYKQHSLMSTISVIRGVVAAASLPFYARMSDTFGRFELFLVAIVFRIVGIIIQWKATDVQKYGAGVVLYGFGVAGMRILWQINLSDASSLRWRLAAIGVLSMTTIITTWSSGEVVNSLLEKHSWKFGISMWAFTTPLVCVPYMVFFLGLIIKASKTDAWKELKREKRAKFIEDHPIAKRYDDEINARTTQSGRIQARLKYACVRTAVALKQIFWKVDFIGCLLIAVVFGLILVPLTLAGGTSLSGSGEKWKRASIIVPLVIGFCSIGLFVLWETKIAHTPMLPFKVMRNRGVWAAFLVGIFSTLITGLPNGYSYPVLLVGMNATPTVATRTGQLNSFVEGITMPILGYVLSRVRRTKGFVLFGNCVMFIAMGLFIHFRGTNDGYKAKYFRDGVAISMCIMGFAGVFFYRVVFVSVQACTNHEYMATVTALFASFYQIGASIGSAISGAIWTQDMYRTIYNQMAKLDVDTSLAKPAYQSPYQFIKKHKWGTEPRRAVSMAYAEIQRKLAITGLCLCVPMLVWVLLLRDHRLTDSQNLDDEAAVEEGKTPAENTRTRVAFTDDKDYILDFIKRLIGRK